MLYFDSDKRDRVETYESANEAYVVENFDFAPPWGIVPKLSEPCSRPVFR